MKQRLAFVGAAVWLLLAVLWIGLLSAWPAQAQTGRSRQFDHTATGYALTGAHANERCEACHVNGIFKGTPKDCASCHTAGARLARNNTVMPQQHLPTAWIQQVQQQVWYRDLV